MINKVILQGRLVADPELKQTSNGIEVCEATIAWSEKYKENERRLFLRCKFWNATATHLCKYFRKGQELAVEGRLETEEWEKDGEKKSRTICTADKVHFCGSKADNSAATDNGKNETEPTPHYAEPKQSHFEEIGSDDDLPF